MIQTDDQMLLVQECVANLRGILLEARKVHSRQDYARMAEPILREVQQREREILEYLSRDLGQTAASEQLRTRAASLGQRRPLRRVDIHMLINALQ